VLCAPARPRYFGYSGEWSLWWRWCKTSLVPLQCARAMTGCERDGLVVEVQPREVVRAPLLVPPALELQRAGYPQVARVEANDFAVGVQDAAVAGPSEPPRVRRRLVFVSQADSLALMV
jgi:hypothetical protein